MLPDVCYKLKIVRGKSDFSVKNVMTCTMKCGYRIFLQVNLSYYVSLGIWITSR